jgi:hypothetical protein
MIRSSRIPPTLNRICDDKFIHSVVLVTKDGELLGSSNYHLHNTYNNSHVLVVKNNEQLQQQQQQQIDMRTSNTTSLPWMALSTESLGTLLADIAMEYHQLGHEYAAIGATQRSKSDLQFVLMEFESALIGISATSSSKRNHNTDVAGAGISSGSGPDAAMASISPLGPADALAGVGSGGAGVSSSHSNSVASSTGSNISNSEVGLDCFVIAITHNTSTPPGLLRTKVQALAKHIQESLALVGEGTQ